MTPEQQRIAIAEACGWVFHQGETPTYGGRYKLRGWCNGEEWRDEPPDYLNDLNAMQNAVNCLSIVNRNAFLDCLGFTFSDSWDFANATAAQRAEAFLRTIGKWTE